MENPRRAFARRTGALLTASALVLAGCGRNTDIPATPIATSPQTVDMLPTFTADQIREQFVNQINTAPIESLTPLILPTDQQQIIADYQRHADAITNSPRGNRLFGIFSTPNVGKLEILVSPIDDSGVYPTQLSTAEKGTLNITQLIPKAEPVQLDAQAVQRFLDTSPAILDTFNTAHPDLQASMQKRDSLQFLITPFGTAGFFPNALMYNFGENRVIITPFPRTHITSGNRSATSQAVHTYTEFAESRFEEPKLVPAAAGIYVELWQMLTTQRSTDTTRLNGEVTANSLGFACYFASINRPYAEYAQILSEFNAKGSILSTEEKITLIILSEDDYTSLLGDKLSPIVKKQ